MFRGPSFIVSTMQEETTPIFKRLWYDWTKQQPGIEPTNPLGQCWVPPIVALLRSAGVTEDLFVTRELHQEPPPWIPTGPLVVDLHDFMACFENNLVLSEDNVAQYTPFYVAGVV